MQKLITGMKLSRPPRREPPTHPLHRSPDRVWRFATPSAAQQRLGIWVTSTGMHRKQPPHNLVNHRVMDCYAVVLIARGSGFFESAVTGRQRVGAGALLWCLPGVWHSYTPDDSTWDERWIVFGGRLPDELTRQGCLNPAHAIDTFGNDEEICSLFDRIDKVFMKAGPLSSALAAPMVHQLILVAHGLRTGLLRMHRNVDPAVSRAIALVEREAASGISPQELARRVNVSYPTLRRNFRRQTSFSVKEYILRVQLSRAKDLLATTGMSVTEVARQCGFENALYFSRLFAQKEGVPPRVFRSRQTLRT
ncbi:MAG TPA: AraC family transcriptional regulator [Planctomycetota bacterium]|nr:AraC family transcriptional regulator [Planctomycetota bacterium]